MALSVLFPSSQFQNLLYVVSKFILFFRFFIEETISSICAISNCLLPFVFVVVVVDDDVIVGVVSSHWILHNTKEVKNWAHQRGTHMMMMISTVYFVPFFCFSSLFLLWIDNFETRHKYRKTSQPYGRRNDSLICKIECHSL